MRIETSVVTALMIALSALTPPNVGAECREASGAGHAVRVGRVHVEVADEVPAARRSRLERDGTAGVLAREIERALADAGALDTSSPDVLHVALTDLRVVPGSTAPWSGVGRAARPYRVDHLGRGDALDLAVTRRANGRAVHVHEGRTTVHAANGPWRRERRVERLARAAACEIASAMAGRGTGR